MVEGLIKANQTKNSKIVNQTIDSINELKNAVNKKEIPENENPNKIIDIVEKILEFKLKDFFNNINNQQKGAELKILTRKQMLQRLPIVLAQVKGGNNSENLLNEIRQIVYSLYQSKEITKKVYNNLMKSL